METIAAATNPGIPISVDRAGRWLPSLTEIVFASVLLWLIVGGRPSALLADGDTGWHIRTGETILAERRFPTTDPYSFSRPGAPWFAWEWGSDVLFALAHRAAGLGGVALLGAALIAATLAVLFHFLVWERVNVIAAVVTMLASGSASTVHWLARPHLFTYLLFVCSLWLLEADRRKPGRRVWWLVPLAVVWVNLHGGFLVLLAALGAYTLGATLAGDWGGARRYGLITAVAAVATLANPYTYQLHLHIARYLQSDFIRDRVEEFQSPRFRGESMLMFELLLLAGLIAVPRLWRSQRYGAALLVLGLAHMALTSVRHVLLYVLAAAPAVAAQLTDALRGRCDQWSMALRSIASPAARLSWVPVLPLAAVAIAAAALDSGRERWRAEFPAEKFPVAALSAAEEKGLGRRIFTSDQWADYLIYRRHPHVRVFIDGRSDFYGAAIGEQYLEALTAHHRWEQVLNQNGFDVALLPVDWPLSAVLKAHPGWQLDYDDGQALVLRRVWESPASSAKSTGTP